MGICFSSAADRPPADAATRSRASEKPFPLAGLPSDIGRKIRLHVFLDRVENVGRLDEAERTPAYASLARSLPDGHENAAHAALRARIPAIADARIRAAVIGVLAERLPPRADAAYAALRGHAAAIPEPPVEPGDADAFEALALQDEGRAVHERIRSARSSGRVLALGRLAAHPPAGGEVDAHGHLRADASTIADLYLRAGALDVLAEHPPRGGEATAHADLRERASTIAEPFARACAIVGLASHPPQGDESAAHADLCERASTIASPLIRLSTFAGLAARLPKGGEAAAHAGIRRRASATADPQERAQILLGLVTGLPPGREAAAAAHADLRERIGTIDFEMDGMPIRGPMLAHLAMGLPAGGEADAHRDLRERISAIDQEETRAESFAILAGYPMPEGDAAEARADLRRRISAIADPTARAYALARLAEVERPA